MFVLFGILTAALLTDLFRSRIPNLLILIGYLSGITCAVLTENPWYLCLFDGLAILLFLYPLYLIGAFGGGDIKLLSVIGLFLGLPSTVNIVLTAIMAGAVCSVIKIIFLLSCRRKISFSNLTIHFSLPIFIGTILIVFGGISWITF
ncbi:MAG: prepilin peptidase [Lachnospiraceae bacterium]|nr:prepilin peptidase [Lachnospiraceae bacterium]